MLISKWCQIKSKKPNPSKYVNILDIDYNYNKGSGWVPQGEKNVNFFCVIVNLL